MHTDTPTQQAPPARPPVKLLQQISAYRTSQCIRAAVELGLPGLLDETPRTASELARATGTVTPLLTRLLDHLVNEEVFGRDDHGRYFNSASARFLIAGQGASLQPWIAFELDPLYWRSWEKLPDQLRHGKAAFELSQGRPFFEWLAEDVAAQQRFDNSMRAISMALISVAVGHLRFAEGETIVDVGGGDGSLLAELLARNPGTKGVLFELPRTAGSLNPRFDQMLREGRATLRHGSFFDTIPSGGDGYVFSRILHDFDDEAVKRIMAQAFAATRGPERFIVVDIMLEPDRPKPGQSSQDMLMMVLLGGRERTVDEFAALLAASGFAHASATPTASPFHILEFRRAASA